MDKESALNKQDIENFKKEVAREFSDVRHDFKATAFQNLKREIDNSLKNNVSHDERPA